MSIISAEEVARVAELARLDLTSQEIEQYATDLDKIVAAVAVVNEVATDQVAPTSHPLPLTNVWREDEPEAPLPQDLALRGAPAQEDGRFAVPQILGED